MLVRSSFGYFKNLHCKYLSHETRLGISGPLPYDDDIGVLAAHSDFVDSLIYCIVANLI